MSEEGGGAKRRALEGTDYVYPRATNKILAAYLKLNGVPDEDVMINYAPSRGSIERRTEQVHASIEWYLSALETADRQVAEAKSARLKDKIASLRDQIRKLNALEAECAPQDNQISLTNPDARFMATSGKDTGWSAAVCRPAIRSITLRKFRIRNQPARGLERDGRAYQRCRSHGLERTRYFLPLRSLYVRGGRSVSIAYEAVS
jgi:Periplasmic binding protein domain